MAHLNTTTDDALLSSLDPLETTVQSLEVQTAAQHKLHSRFTDARLRNWQALSNSHNNDLAKRADRMAGCCRFPRAIVLGNGRPGLSLNRCRDRCCPRCGTHRGRELALKIAHLTRQMDSPRLITLTIASKPGEGLRELLDHLRASFRRIRKLPLWRSKVKGGVYTVEVTRNEQTGAWHPHVHIVADGSYWDQASISSAWEEASEGSKIVDVRKINNATQTAKYVADYVAKPYAHGSWDADAICEWAEAMHRQRLSHTFGSLHGVKVEETDETDEVRAADDLGSTLWIKTSANKGNRIAERMVELVRAWGPTWRGAFGIDEADKVDREVDAAEEQEFIVLAESLRAEFMRSENREPPLTRRPHDNYLFAVHDAHAIRRT